MPGFNNFGGGGGGQRGRRPYSDPNDPESEQYRKLFVGGLSYETTDDGLKAHFEQWGEIEDHIVMKDPQSKRSRGFGFITYTKSHMLDDAQGARPHNIDGREVETKRAMPREDSGKPDVHSSAKKMFIGAMKEGTTEEMIREVFEEFGAIAKVDMVMDKATGKLKSFCFVEFEDYDPVDKCVLKREFELNGKRVEVKKAHPKGGDGAAGGGGGRGGRGGGRGGRGGGQSFGGGYGQGGGGFGNQGYDNYGGGYGGGYNDGGFGGGYNQGGGYDNYGGGYGQGGGDWNSFGQGYTGNMGGGPMRGQFGGSSRGAPYQGGGGGYGGGGGRGGYNR